VIAYISIGNSDDKLTQAEWAEFFTEVDLLLAGPECIIGGPVQVRHGVWHSLPDSPWQNACWCVELLDDAELIADLKGALADHAQRFRQDSIAWAVADTEFIGAAS